jgi:hypothetical protein
MRIANIPYHWMAIRKYCNGVKIKNARFVYLQALCNCG